MSKQICAVCSTLDNDNSLKECSWCDFCGVWICSRDLYSARRILAWAKSKGLNLEKLKKALKIG